MIRDEEVTSLSVCACTMNGTYQPVNKMVVLDVYPEGKGKRAFGEHSRTESGKSMDGLIFEDHGKDPKVTLLRRFSESILPSSAICGSNTKVAPMPPI